MNRTLFFKDEDACSTPEIGHALKADDALKIPKMWGD